MPTGTGKTVSLLALIIAYLAQKPEHVKKVTNNYSSLSEIVNLLHQNGCRDGKNIKRSQIGIGLQEEGKR